MNLFISGRKLANCDGFFGKSDPYVIIKQFKPYSQEFDIIGQTEVVKNNLNPDFQPIKVQYHFEKQQRLMFECFDQDKNGFEMIGVFETSMGEICGKKGQTVSGDLHKPDKDKFRGQITIRAVSNSEAEANPGLVPAAQPKPPMNPGFLDYLRSGWQISFAVGIDYTASNEPADRPNSLHYMGPGNQYQRAIMSVGSVIQAYDYDKKFPVFGFGGIPHYMNVKEVSHCFPLTGDPAAPDVNGVEGILAAYQ